MTTPDHTLAARLAPCPFCGGQAEFSKGKTGDGKDWHYIECASCEAMGPRVEYADHNIAVKEALAAAWNTRSNQLITTAESDARVKAAVLAEREAIAAFVETHAYTVGTERKMEPSKQAINDMHHATIAAAIRARGVTG